MLTIDGRFGGGQLLRTALTLSVMTETPFEINHVRGERPKPGLRPQHVAAVEIVEDLCDADVAGATVGSESLTFQPGFLQSMPREIDIGTAGSVMLLFDAFLPFATKAERAIELTAIGGTDVKWSPTIAYFSQVKLPLLERFGFTGATELERTGFYPAGGGRATLHLEPTTLDPLRLVDRGSIDRVEVFSKASTGLESREVADRQAERAKERLETEDVPVEISAVEYVSARSTGSSLLLRAVYEGSMVGFDAVGERGKSSEAVADGATDRFFGFHHGAGTVDEHMADQLLVFIALAGGRMRAPRLTAHIESNAAVTRQFGFDLRLEEQVDGTVVVGA